MEMEQTMEQMMECLLAEVKALLKTDLEEMKAMMNVFEERLDKMNTARKACLGKTEANIGTGQEPREAENKTNLQEMGTTDLEAS
jgi:hypothetical protein